MYNSGYPTTNFSWRDNSGANTDTLYSPPTEGLCVPFSFIMAERGEPGVIYYGGAAELTPLLGSATFDSALPYYNSATKFLSDAMAGQGVEVMRMVDPAATTADLGLFVSVTQMPVTQYKKDNSGSRILDSNGNPIPLLKADGVTVVTEPGVSIKWSVRGLTDTESFDTLVKSTTTVGNVTTVTYPVMGLKVHTPGAYGNRQGFKLYSTNTQDTAVSQNVNSVLYRFVPMELATSISTTASTILDAYGAQFSDVSFKNVAIYTATATNFSFDYALNNNYVDTKSGRSTLPYDISTYGANIGLIGEAVLAVSPELGQIDPYLIDLISGKDGNGNHYDHVVIDDSSAAVVNSASTNYALGGSDGDTSWPMFEEQVRNWLTGGDHGDFANLQQHPMTHFSDPGFSMTTKSLLFNMLDLRDNFKVDVSTQDIMLPANTKAEDISAGQALLFRAQMHPESLINGVGCTRVGIYAHAAYRADGGPYGGLIPLNYNRMIQRRNLDGGSYVKGSSGGFPNSQVIGFRKLNWVADDEPTQALAWAGCINVVRHKSRTELFCPSLRTVYPNDTSLLSDDEVSDRIIYMFKIVRDVWATYVGVRNKPKKLFTRIQTDITNRCNAAFSADNIRVIPTVFQTATDANLGTSVSVNLEVQGDLPIRVFNFNVLVERAAA